MKPPRVAFFMSFLKWIFPIKILGVRPTGSIDVQRLATFSWQKVAQNPSQNNKYYWVFTQRPALSQSNPKVLRTYFGNARPPVRSGLRFNLNSISKNSERGCLGAAGIQHQRDHWLVTTVECTQPIQWFWCWCLFVLLLLFWASKIKVRQAWFTGIVPD